MLDPKNFRLKFFLQQKISDPIFLHKKCWPTKFPAQVFFYPNKFPTLIFFTQNNFLTFIFFRLNFRAKKIPPRYFWPMFFWAPQHFYQNFVSQKKFDQNLICLNFCLPKNLFHRNFRKLQKKYWSKNKKNQLISAKQHNLIITRNGFDIIVN